MEQEKQTNRDYVNKYIKDNYVTFKFRIRKENQQAIKRLREVGNMTQYIIGLVEEDIKRNTKYNYIDDSIKIDFGNVRIIV